MILLYAYLSEAARVRWMIIDGRKAPETVKSIRVRDALISAVSFLKSTE